LAPAVGLDETARDRQAEPGPLRARAPALERAEDALAVGGGNPRAVVEDLDPDVLAVEAGARQDRGARRGVVDRVLEQVGHDLVHLGVVARHGR
jgi:hypothetical protein